MPEPTPSTLPTLRQLESIVAIADGKTFGAGGDGVTLLPAIARA